MGGGGVWCSPSSLNASVLIPACRFSEDCCMKLDLLIRTGLFSWKQVLPARTLRSRKLLPKMFIACLFGRSNNRVLLNCFYLNVGSVDKNVCSAERPQSRLEVNLWFKMELSCVDGVLKDCENSCLDKETFFK